MDYSADSLVYRLRQRAGIPANALLNDSDILQEFDFELIQKLVPDIMRVNEDYFVKFIDQNINSTNIYDIPPSAMGKKLRMVNLINTQGNIIYSVPRFDLANIPNFRFGLGNINSFPIGFYMQDNQLYIYPQQYSNTAMILRFYYYRRPSQLVLKENGRPVTVSSPTQFSVSSIPAGWSNPVQIDIISKNPSYDVVYENIAASWSGTTFTIADTSRIINGDFVNLTGETCFPQIPQDLTNCLLQAVEVRMYEILGDPKLDRAVIMYDKMMKDVLNILTPRVDGETLKIVSNNSLGNFIV